MADKRPLKGLAWWREDYYLAIILSVEFGRVELGRDSYSWTVAFAKESLEGR